MDNKKAHGQLVVYASQTGAKLNSDVVIGGGTDDTDVLQRVLDTAHQNGGLYLIMDGAALVRGLKISSDTTIECLNRSCGFFLQDGCDCALISNSELDMKAIKNKNISLLGGTYNFNSPGQNRYKGYQPGGPMDISDDFFAYEWSHGMRFFGVKNLILRDLSLVNQRTFAIIFANWFNVVIENVDIPLPDLQYAQNQDGLHFWGPGAHLSLKNVSGRAGDDFIALAPDENDHVSDITDVSIDGVYLEDADQGIRLLSRHKGRLDRVFIRNVYGYYKSFGITLNPWFGDGDGNYGNITIENIHLQPTYHKYLYTNPYLIRVGGYVESLTIKNVKVINSNDNRTLIDLSRNYGEDRAKDKYLHIINLTIDGLDIINTNGTKDKTDYISLDSKVDNFVLRNVIVHRSDENKNNDSLIILKDGTDIGTLFISNVIVNGIGEIIEKQFDTSIDFTHTDNIVKNSIIV